MSYQVQYTYDLINKISGELDKINQDLQKHSNIAKKNLHQVSKAFDEEGKKIKKLSKAFDEEGKKIRNIGLKYTAFISAPITLMTKSILKAASDAEEITSKFDVVFQNVAKSANKSAKQIASGYGLSIVKSKELLGDTGDLLSGFGFTGEMALDLSSKVQKLAVDLASFTNYSGGAEGASQALTKALLGEREQAKMLGIAILENDVKRKVEEMSLKGVTFESQRQAKAYATLLIAQEQSKNAIGDYARTSESYANKSRVLSQRLFDLKVKFGNLILPEATVFLGKIIRLTEKFSELSPKAKKTIMVLGGLGLVLPPIIASVGLLVMGIGGLLSPIGLAITGFTTLAGVGVYLYNKFEPVKNIIDTILELMAKVTKFTVGGGFVEFGAKMLGFDMNTIGQEQGAIVNNPAVKDLFTSPQQGNTGSGLFSKPQQVNMGGELSINLSGLPAGSNVSYTPAPSSKLQTRLNSSYN